MRQRIIIASSGKNGPNEKYASDKKNASNSGEKTMTGNRNASKKRKMRQTQIQ
jgi:hypothetical protein